MLKKFFYLCELVWKLLSERNRHEMIEAGLVLGAKIGQKSNIYWCLSNGAWRKLAYIEGTQPGWDLKWQLLKGLGHEIMVVLRLAIFGANHDRFTLPYKTRNKMEQYRLAEIEPFKLRKKYIITLPDIPESLAGANLCMKTAEFFGEREGMEIFPGINKEQSEEFFKSHNLTWSYHRQLPKPKSMTLAEMGCFASHFMLWKKCVNLDEPIMVLEDDVKLLASIPALRFHNFVYLGRLPKYVGRNVIDTLPTSLDEVYYPFKCSVGSFAYGISPDGARKLLSSAQRTTVYAVDNFMTPHKLHMVFYRQQPIMTNAEFSLIR